ncbi:MAG: hypothetical protein Q8K65_10175 [Alphaproteobacteria bacterium]|nr:hypothetical protein [Alphaproteobacteria bacterium]
MTNPQAPDTGDIAQQLKSVLDYVKDCDRRVHLGEIMDLDGLDDKVMQICDVVASLSQEDAQVYEAQMGVLITELEKLAKSMQEQQIKIDSGER